MTYRASHTRLALVMTACCVGLVAPTGAEAQNPSPERWVMPRTPEGHPDLQGNWTNATITPIQRPEGQPQALTAEQVAAVEGGRQEIIAEDAEDSDPNREAPPAGGVWTGDPLFDAATGGTGGYNYFWIDAGDRVAIWNGEPRSSLITRPDDGRRPSLTPEGRQRVLARREQRARFADYDNPENRPLAERCIMSFGSNGGPPMLPNYFYNNNYTIVQTPDHVMIMTEMVHDVRIIRMGDPRPLPDHVRPWMGDSWGRWEGDALVVETTHFPLEQIEGYSGVIPGASKEIKVVERFSRTDEFTINYEFTVIDPETYTSEWGGQVPFKRMDDLVYEYACHEANYALSNVLSGARSEEREAAKRGPGQPPS